MTPDPYRLRYLSVLSETLIRLTADARGHSRSIGDALGVELDEQWDHCMASAASHMRTYLRAVEAAAARVEDER